jgi:hypothetical protein
MARCEALDMDFIDDTVVPGHIRRAVSLPVERRVDHNALRLAPGIVAVIAGKIGSLVPELIPEDWGLPVHASANGLGIGVNQQLGRIAPESFLRLVRAVDPVAIQLTWSEGRQVSMPDMASHLSKSNTFSLRFRVSVVKQTQFDFLGGFRIDGEIHTFAVPSSAQRIGIPR